MHFAVEAAAFLFGTALAWVFFTEVYTLADTGGPLPELYPYAASLGVGAALYHVVRAIDDLNRDIVRGERLVPTWQVKLLSRWKTLGDRYKFFWGGLWYAFEVGVKCLAAVGAPGSGKTVNIRLFLQSTMRWIGIAPDHRALIYDATGIMKQILSGMGIDVSLARRLVLDMDPYIEGSFAWELCEDLKQIKDIDEIVTIFISPEGGGDPFWRNASRRHRNLHLGGAGAAGS